MRITRLEAKGIGPFEDLNIEFKPKPAGMENKAEIHILTGENGTGKSTILMMLASCADVSNDEKLYKRYRTNQTWIVKDLTKLKSFFSLNFDEANEFVSYSMININGFNEIQTSITSKGARFYNNIYDLNAPFFAYSGYRQVNTQNNITIAEPNIKPFEKAIEFDKSVDFDLIVTWIAMSKTKMLLAQNRGDKNASEKHGKTVLKIEETISEIIKKQVKFEVIDEPSFKVLIKIDNQSYDFNILPDGLKSIISWLSDLLMRLDRINWVDKTKSILEQNFILFLDEIEVHLHPSWQRKILPVVQDLFPNAQIFISTHSPFVVGSVDGARVYKFKLDENNNSVLDSEYWTEDGNSYQYYLREVFDVKNEFGVKIDESLQELQRLKEKALKGSIEDYEKFMILSDKLLNENPNSVELSSIVGFERRKLEKQFPTQPVTV